MGRRHGLPCLLLDRVCTMIYEIEDGTRVQSDEAVRELLVFAQQLPHSEVSRTPFTVAS